MLDQLTHISWITIAGIALAGLGIVYWGNLRRSRNLLLTGLAAVVLACLLVAARTLIVTDRARCEKRTTAIVAAANREDWATFASLLDEHTVVHTVGSQSVAGRKKIVSEVQEKYVGLGVKGVGVRSLESKQDQTLITVDLVVASTQDRTQDYPITTTWQFDYDQTGKDWTLDTITLIRLGNDAAQGLFNAKP